MKRYAYPVVTRSHINIMYLLRTAHLTWYNLKVGGNYHLIDWFLGLRWLRVNSNSKSKVVNSNPFAKTNKTICGANNNGNQTIQATIFNLELGESSWRVSSFSQEYKRESFNHSSNEISLPKVFWVYFPTLISHPIALNP